MNQDSVAAAMAA